MNAGKVAINELRSVVNAGIYLHSGVVGAALVKDFEQKLQLYLQGIHYNTIRFVNR